MEKFCTFCLLLFSLFCCGGEELRIADATCGAPLDAIRSVALRLAVKQGFSVSIDRLKPADALKELQEKKRDIVILERREIPASWRGYRKAWAAEAFCAYVHHSNPLRSIRTKELLRVLSEYRPLWTPLNGQRLDIHRIALASAASGGDLAERILKSRELSPVFLPVQRTEEGALLLVSNPAALLTGRFLPEHSAEIAALSVDGVLPDIGTVSRGEYPLCFVYEILTGSEQSAAAKVFLENASERLLYDRTLDSGLLPVLDKTSLPVPK